MAREGGQENLDIGALSAELQEKLFQFKVNTRIDNESYLASHPEVKDLIGDFIREVMRERPSDIRGFAIDHFTNVSKGRKSGME